MTITYTCETLGIFMFKNDCCGAALTIADGDENVFYLPGNDSSYIVSGPDFSTTPSIENNCFFRAAKNKVSGASGTIRYCPISDQTFLATMVNGYATAYDDMGNILAVISKPGAEDCFTCSKSEETCEAGITVVHIVCVRDCSNNVVGCKASIIRNMTDLELAQKTQRGGTQSKQEVDLTANFQAAGECWGLGPGDQFPVYEDPAGTIPDCSPVVPCVDVDITGLEDLLSMCACDSEVGGRFLTAADVASGLVPDIPLLTGV